MADNKKYYYMRLKENFFDSNEIVVLESMQDGYLYSNILLKLYLRSLKNDGKLMFNDCIPYNPQMIATITRHQVGTVEKALRIFKDMGLIEVMETGAIYMLDIQQYIGKSSTESDRKRKYRAKIEAERTNVPQIVPPVSQKCPDKNPPEIEIELEIEKEPEIERENKTRDKPVRHRYGEYDHVLLSGEDMQKLQEEFPNDWMNRIRNLDEYIEKTGKSYKNPLLVIRTWARKDAERKPKDSLAFIDEMVERMEKEKGADDGIF